MSKQEGALLSRGHPVSGNYSSPA
ncbi:hypothetical protein FOXYSP1_19356 [Fusarium oxysporum f. sp. phaseoli]